MMIFIHKLVRYYESFLELYLAELGQVLAQ